MTTDSILAIQTKHFGCLYADCLLVCVGDSQGISRQPAGKYPCETIATRKATVKKLSLHTTAGTIGQSFQQSIVLLELLTGFEPARRR